MNELSRTYLGWQAVQKVMCKESAGTWDLLNSGGVSNGQNEGYL